MHSSTSKMLSWRYRLHCIYIHTSTKLCTNFASTIKPSRTRPAGRLFSLSTEIYSFRMELRWRVNFWLEKRCSQARRRNGHGAIRAGRPVMNLYRLRGEKRNYFLGSRCAPVWNCFPRRFARRAENKATCNLRKLAAAFTQLRSPLYCYIYRYRSRRHLLRFRWYLEEWSCTGDHESSRKL